MTKVGLYFHTVRHLKPRQVLARAWNLASGFGVDLRRAPPLRSPNYRFVEPVAPLPTLVSEFRFKFLNVERPCESAADWTPAGADDLWIYHLHYFDDLNAQDAGKRTRAQLTLLRRWVAENAPGMGSAWDPYPTSRRIVNWIKWVLRGNQLPSECVDSLATQARWLARRFEFHLLGNHLLANAKGLLFAGLFFSGKEADIWFRKGMSVFNRQLREQVLTDGAHFELSPMYHAIVLEDLLDGINLVRAYGLDVPAHWPGLASRMRTWLSVMTHPDGGIAFFNDAVFGASASLSDIDSYVERLELSICCESQGIVEAMIASGYIAGRTESSYLLCDCAAVGPDYQPGHAHADTLSFELSLYGQRVFVNSGISKYDDSLERQRQRGTAAHNTVVIDGSDSSEVWKAFRVARRARASLHRVSSDLDGAMIEASHDGYCRRPSRRIHRRRWQLCNDRLEVTDEIGGRFRRAVALFHLSPGVEIRRRSSSEFAISWSGAEGQVSFQGTESVQIQNSSWHPRFGESVPNSRLVAHFTDRAMSTSVSWRKK